MPWYPLPALIFLAITGWTVLYTAIQYPIQLLVTAAVIALGYPPLSANSFGAVNGSDVPAGAKLVPMLSPCVRF